MTKKQIIGWIVTIVLTLFCWCVPTDFFGIEGLTVIQQRIIALFVFSACMWICEAIPIWATSVVIMVLMLLTTSDSMFGFMKGDPAIYGEPISYKTIMAAFADPTVMLFMGGFVLAIGATKYKLDANLARCVIGLFGKKPKMVMLGFILITAVLSMFMSNTATAAMMMAILVPVLGSLPESDNKGKVGLALAIPVAANVGGIGTPIGTPPNVVAVKYLTEMGIEVGFLNWMMVMVPFMLIILFIAWTFLSSVFKSNQNEIIIKIDGSWDKSPKAIAVYITFVITILLWIFGKDLLGVNANVVALIPFAAFCIFGVFEKKDLAKIDWDVLWLVAGGFALGVGINQTHLAELLVNTIPFNNWSALVVILGSGLLCIVMSTFMSNSATAALLIPILGVVAGAMSGEGGALIPFGGATTVIIGLAMAASLAMALPISTPPNAIAYSKGFIKQKDMALTGIFVGIVGLIIGYVILIFAGKAGLFA